MSIQKITKIALFIALIVAFEPLCWGAANPEREIGLLAQLYKDSDHVASGVLASLGNPELQQLARIGRKESERFPKLYQDVMGELLKRKIKQLSQENFGDAQEALQELLFDAAVNNQAWAIDYLVKNGAKVNAKGSGGFTALWRAAQRGNEAVVVRLLAAGADVNTKDRDEGQTPLGLAAVRGHEAVVARLLAAGADVNAKSGTWTALMWAAYKGDEAVVARLLAAAGVDVNMKDSDDRTALMLAVMQGHGAVVALLLAATGVDVNAKDSNGTTPLMFAAFWGHEGVVAQLLAVAGVNVNATNSQGRTALWYAMQGRYGAVVTQLIAAGADFDDLELQELKDIGVEIGG